MPPYMPWDELIRECREHYAHMGWKSDTELALYVQDWLLQLSKVPEEDLTDGEKERLKLLPSLAHYLV